MKTYAKPALRDLPLAEEITVDLSERKTLTVEIPDADFDPYSNARLILDEGSPVGAFTPLTEGEEGTPRKDVTVTITNFELADYIDKLVELRYEVTYESSGDIDRSEPQKLRIEASR
ncbi:hypothetical protein HU715_024950 [Pseudomonas sp. SWRI12]|uniref:Uncharacterized protein n=1 Tax=Pseudomonas zanjanensis TaxID=2745496 RepID=A0A923FIQ3_9PSED|nr:MULTISPECIES: hypothetical protein [Pseudomonas]MBC3386603.1 hypothetical protein [Pseudomonas sp. SWRI179]MBV4498596.1 hypothetical protein [Pseudomonas zanjanensis]